MGKFECGDQRSLRSPQAPAFLLGGFPHSGPDGRQRQDLAGREIDETAMIRDSVFSEQARKQPKDMVGEDAV
jgi:hypothetical protein